MRELLPLVSDEASFLEFAKAFLANRQAKVASIRESVDVPDQRAHGWRNHSIEDFFDAAIAWADSTDIGEQQGIPKRNIWHRVVNFPCRGKVYE
ncbi:MAG: hypothetical protein AAFQ89_22310 [Cyanobacteria bacterium J06626_18]